MRRRFDWAEPIPGPSTEAPREAGRRSPRLAGRLALRAPGLACTNNTGRRPRRSGPARRSLSQDAHPGRSALLREVLLHARGPRFPGPRTPPPGASACSSAGPVVPEAARATALLGADILFYPTADRLAVRRGCLRRRGAARRLAHDPAIPCDRERPLRRRREPGRPRAARGVASRHGHPVLGQLFRRADPMGRDARGRAGRCGGRARRRVRSKRRRARCAATGPSCAIAASTPIKDSAIASAIEGDAFDRSARPDAARARGRV